jgi:hypothetical protein
VSTGEASGPKARAVMALILIAAVAVATVAIPCLPANPDLYLHLLWTHQVMRCLAQGALPVWAPDLNAGFGSPGIRLHSPLAPFVQGSLGLLGGTAERGIRAAAFLSAGLLGWLLWRRHERAGIGMWVLLLSLPVVVNSLLGRSAFPEFLAVPLTFWLLEAAVAGRVSPVREGLVLSVLWLLHAPSTVMVVLLAGAASVLRGDRKLAVRLLAAVALAAGLTAWHWMPLASEMREVGSAHALTEGLYSADRNYLGSPTAFNVDKNIWLGWVAVAQLAACLVGGWYRRPRARLMLILVALALASPLTAWLWRLPTPLLLLQFPFRWLLPAGVLAVDLARKSWPTWRGRLAVGLLLAPSLLLVRPDIVRDPGLTAAMGWHEVGTRIQASIGGNPLVVDAVQHRPPSWSHLAENLRAFGAQPVLVEPAGRFRIERWQPLSRVAMVELPGPARVSFRLLDYPFWRVEIDGAPASSAGRPGVVGAFAPAGRHQVRAVWGGDPWSRVGAAAGLATLAALGWCAFRARSRRELAG